MTKTATKGASFEQLAAELLKPRWYYPILTAIVVVLWCTFFERWPGTAAFEIPVSYNDRGDALYTLGVSHAFSEIPAPWNLRVEHLNAPFGADWNDYPHTEKFVFYTCGILRCFFEAGTAANLALMLCHWGAAVAFAWTARRLGASAGAALAGALLYGFSLFIVGRGLGHLNIAVVWHIPLLLHLVKSIASIVFLPSRGVQLGAIALMVATSILNPYYTVLFLQLLLLATLRSSLLGRRVIARFGLLLAGVCVASFFLGQLNVYLRAWTAGTNASFSGRDMGALLTWGLRLPDLFMPRNHPIQLWADFASTHYFEAGNPGTENGFAFLGAVGCLLLLALVTTALLRGLQERFNEIPWEAWLVGYVALFALAGGLNYLLGAVGMTWLRAANRYSIVILCAVLLWGAEIATRFQRTSIRIAATGGALSLGLLELFGTRSADFPDRAKLIARIAASDRHFARDLERLLPGGANVFQLPVSGFPESPSIQQMGDYEQFRPYLWTRSLRFSYGTHKGREREAWQRHAEGLQPRDMVEYLEQHGFDAIVINRKGFADRAASLERALGDYSRQLTVSAEKDFAAYRITKRASRLPEDYSPIALDEGFPWGWEEGAGGRWAWSNGRARLRVLRPILSGRRYRVSFEAESLVERQLDVLVGETRVASVRLEPGATVPIKFDWAPRSNQARIVLETDAQMQRPSNGDSRMLGFRIMNPKVEERSKSHEP